MLAAAILKVAAGKAAAAAGDRIMLQWRFEKDLEYMRDTMESIEVVLVDAEKRSIEDKSVQLWLERLTRASYDISDLFDEFEANAVKKSAFRKARASTQLTTDSFYVTCSFVAIFKVPTPCLTLTSEVGMACKMKKVREKLENISNERRRYSFMTSNNSSNVQQVINERATSSNVVEADILGRDEEKQKVIALLMEASMSSEFIVLPIYGIGGIGKTTLAQLLYNDTHFKNHGKAWVYVSQLFDLTNIKMSVISQLQMEQGQLSSTREQDAGPSAHRNILIVLDDLWEEDDFKLDDLKKSLKIIGNGHRVHVIVTTRDAGIAEKVQTIEAHKIGALSLDVCWTIIKKIVGFDAKHANNEWMDDVGKEIAKKCGGVALAARALGFMLRSRDDVDGWVSVKDSAIWNVSTPGYTPSAYDNVLASLKLSYISIPPHLRLCFAYCLVFPKGHKMAKDELVYQWAALGLITPSDGVSIWQHGETCIKQLLEMSFFQHSKSPLFDKQHGKDVQLFTMHDLARLIMGDGLLDASTKCNSIRGRNYRYALLADCNKPLNSFMAYPDKIRAIRFQRSGETGHCSIGISTAKYLRVLDLGESSLEKLPSSIGQLKLLRYLNAPGMKDRVIPSCITKFSKLIYLSLRGSSTVSLPKSFGEMEALMYLDLSGCTGILEVPKSFGKLESLVHLDLSDCSLTQVDGIPEALSNLTKLQYLNLSRSKNLESKLTVRVLSEVIKTLTELRYLNVSGCRQFYGHSTNDLFDSISNLSNLEHLNFSHCSYLETIPDCICSLRKLHTLDLTGCRYLRRLPRNMGRMDNLKILNVNGCWDLICPTGQ
ncbi:hypothetical protein PR202_ga31624 [Eleusine coracana subsp. coracana]|uniref:Uncharacterized protein n=1 Tax=Eleusine coracana subsp. coracana TaxID=191504 RepID=A0AAV5DST4_ELECO|nr:hypothetical protein PR202_ga31624 [Eleusine coracana subsp. coracana]